MVTYKELKSGLMVEIESGKFIFPTSGANVLLKPRPPLAKESGTD